MATKRRNQLDNPYRGPRVEERGEASSDEKQDVGNDALGDMLSLVEARKLFAGELRVFSKDTQRHHQECVVALEKILRRQNIEVLDVRQLTPRLIRDKFIYYMLDDMDLKPTTVNTRIRGIRAFTKFLHREGFIAKNIGVDLHLVRQERTVINAFTQDQVRALLRQPDRTTFTGVRDYTIMLLFLETGIRVSECTGITLDDVRLREGQILIHGKGAKQRWVPFQSTFRRVLQEYLAARGKQESKALFCTLNGQAMNKRTIEIAIRQYGESAKVTGVRCSPHTFRHTMAKYYILAGGDIFSLQRILGHSSLDMVRLYVDLFGTDIQSQHRKYSFLEHQM